LVKKIKKFDPSSPILFFKKIKKMAKKWVPFSAEEKIFEKKFWKNAKMNFQKNGIFWGKNFEKK
jgi:hypothetical protein